MALACPLSSSPSAGVPGAAALDDDEDDAEDDDNDDDADAVDAVVDANDDRVAPGSAVAVAVAAAVAAVDAGPNATSRARSNSICVSQTLSAYVFDPAREGILDPACDGHLAASATRWSGSPRRQPLPPPPSPMPATAVAPVSTALSKASNCESSSPLLRTSS